MLGVSGMTRVTKSGDYRMGPKGPWKVRLAATGVLAERLG
ncbi:hypothetical protein MRBBS_1619 [Marinobacter sp. BSs20148]|nr:hypothetical protein MRBBS_1619 [Marinobacter sp. BSs20148]